LGVEFGSNFEPMWMAIGALIMCIYKREILDSTCELFNLNMPYKGKAITQWVACLCVCPFDDMTLEVWLDKDQKKNSSLNFELVIKGRVIWTNCLNLLLRAKSLHHEIMAYLCYVCYTQWSTNVNWSWL
jgi:hypothetical protein